MDGFEIDENDPISFDDLGKIYKSISRQRILSNVNVQCPNVHFHAHPDGSTTIHKHKSCPTPSLATLDPRRKTSNDSSKVRVRLFRYILLKLLLSTGGPRIVRILGHQGIVLLRKSY